MGLTRENVTRLVHWSGCIEREMWRVFVALPTSNEFIFLNKQ